MFVYSRTIANTPCRVHYWVEVQTQMRKTVNVETQRSKMTACICAYAGLALLQVIGECLRIEPLVLGAKALGKSALS